MTVDLLLHREAMPDRGAPTWWAECPQVPGFSACFNTIEETVAASRVMIAEALRDRGGPAEELEIRTHVVDTEDSPARSSLG